HRSLRGGRPSLAPLRQSKDGREQVAPLVGQAILRARPLVGLAVVLALEDLGLGQSPESCAQHAASTAQRTGEVVEPAQAIKGLAQDQKRPFLAQHVEGSANAAMFEVIEEAGMVHDCNISEFDSRTQKLDTKYESSTYTGKAAHDCRRQQGSAGARLCRDLKGQHPAAARQSG